jgi:hypothetical protein
MLSQSILIVLVIMLSPVARPTTFGAPGKTDDLLIVSGGENEKRLKAENLLPIDKGQYLIYGDFSIAARTNWVLPLELKIWSRGAGDLSFIELTPLLGVFDDPGSAADLRGALFKTENGGAQIVPEGSDRQRLESLVTKPPAKTNERLKWQRTVALEQMASFNLYTFEELFVQYEKQKAFVQGSWSTAKPSQLGDLIGATSGQTANDDETTAWSNLMKFARDKRLLSPLLRTRISSSTEPRIIAYILMLPSKKPVKLQGEIFLATNQSESVRIPLAVEIESNELFLTKLYAAIPTTLVGLVATFGGAIIGYKFFVYQQNHLRRMEEEKRFANKKVELSKTIRALFKNDYSGLRNNQDSELDRAQQIRGALIDEDIYAILRWEEIQKVNNICDPNYEVPGSRLEALDRILEDNFKEFMV